MAQQCRSFSARRSHCVVACLSGLPLSSSLALALYVCMFPCLWLWLSVCVCPVSVCAFWEEPCLPVLCVCRSVWIFARRSLARRSCVYVLRLASLTACLPVCLACVCWIRANSRVVSALPDWWPAFLHALISIVITATLIESHAHTCCRNLSQRMRRPMAVLEGLSGRDWSGGSGSADAMRTGGRTRPGKQKFVFVLCAVCHFWFSVKAEPCSPTCMGGLYIHCVFVIVLVCVMCYMYDSLQ